MAPAQTIMDAAIARLRENAAPDDTFGATLCVTCADDHADVRHTTDPRVPSRGSVNRAELAMGSSDETGLQPPLLRHAGRASSTIPGVIKRRAVIGATAKEQGDAQNVAFLTNDCQDAGLTPPTALRPLGDGTFSVSKGLGADEPGDAKSVDQDPVEVASRSLMPVLRMRAAYAAA